ncbi:MAG: ComF family protein [Clostridiales bacterium]|nr:ComF family protein [Clostridiales bacterium]
MAGNLRRTGALVRDFLWPTKCLFCQRPLEDGETLLCAKCGPQVPWTGADCAQQGMYFDRCLSPLYYTEVFKPAFHRYKFLGHWHYSWVFGQWMWDCLQANDPDCSRFDCITWAPLSFWRRQRRGYDQARRLALAVSRFSGLPLQQTLVKFRHTPPQSGTEQAALRWENVRGVYRPKSGVPLEGKRLLLVDDVITTGATLEEASAVLRRAGAAEICCLTLARSAYGREGKTGANCETMGDNGGKM